MRFMSSIGLALSGGGFRATLYHLGVIRYLRDCGGLEHVTDIAAVSGGSILAAHLVLNWDRYTGDDTAFAEAAGEVIRFVQFDLRNHIVRRLPLTFPVRIAGRVIGSDMAELSPNAILERYYREFLYGDRRLFELPERPGLHVLTTNVSDGTLAAFNRRGLHILRRESGSRVEDPFQHVQGTMATIAKAVGASSAFPGFFPPVRVTAADLGVGEGQFPGESFTDGGVYDNLGTRAFTWLQRLHDTDYDRVIVSDAGKPFQILGRNPIGFLAQSIRATDILWDRVWQLERENFGDQNGFFFAPVTRIVDPAEDPHALHPVVQEQISTLRTDLDRFTDLEVSALVMHGYEVTRATHRKISDRSDLPIHEGPLWDPLPGRHTLEKAVGTAAVARTTTARAAGTCPVAQLADTLRAGGQRRVWSTLLDLRDWPSYVYAVLAAIIFVWLPIRFWQVHRHAQLLTSVINSIAEGDPDIRLVLDLVDGDPSKDWKPVAVKTMAEATPASDFQGLDVLSFSRIMDLRQADARGGERVKVRDRMLLRFDGTAEGRRHVVFHSLLPVAETSFRQPAGQPPVEIRRVHADPDPAHDHLEIHLDLSGFPAGEPITLELATLMQAPILESGRVPLDLLAPADLLTVWLLFPEDHPYRSYRLLRYPEHDPDAAEPMTPRYTIDHPYGQLIGWSVINPAQGQVYECRWTP
jgi:predicted acylesterase/phospholipase RssA